MKSITQAIYSTPQWVQPRAAQNRFELRAGEELFAVLEFPKPFGSLAVASTEEERWSFKRAGFFSPRVTVRSEGSESDLAVFRPKWTGNEGTLQFPDGAAYIWKTANFWATQYLWQKETGEPLILYKQGIEDAGLGDLFKTQARVEIQPAAQGLKELPLLVLLGWYLMILKQQDDSAVAATAAVG